MAAEPVSPRLYRLQSAPEYGWLVGKTRAGEQAIVGKDLNVLVAIRFSPSGKLLATEQRAAASAVVNESLVVFAVTARAKSQRFASDPERTVTSFRSPRRTRARNGHAARDAHPRPPR
jgi:hypothetical protein